MRTLVLLGVVLVAAFAAGLSAYLWVGRTETVVVIVRGVERDAPEGATLAEAVEQFGLMPAAGDLFDVQGAILRAGALPGHVIVNGHRAAGTTELRAGDRIEVVDGRNRSEPLERLWLHVAGTGPANPQFTLARASGEQEIVRGHISHKVVRLAFHPTGPVRRPRTVALTFDDGPSRYTPRILALLRRLRARATFFVVGDLAERYPSLLRREARAGMGVGNHSYAHPYRRPFDSLSYRRIRAEIEGGAEALSTLGVRVTAPPAAGRVVPRVRAPSRRGCGGAHRSLVGRPGRLEARHHRRAGYAPGPACGSPRLDRPPSRRRRRSLRNGESVTRNCEGHPAEGPQPRAHRVGRRLP